MEYTTRMKTDFLQSALNIVNELGWDEIDIYAVHDESDALCENVMLHIRPKDSPYWGDEAGISVAPRRTQPDKELRDHE
jgi:hypothetical protein